MFKLRGIGWGFLEAVQFFEGAVIIALAGIDNALEALGGRGAGGEGVAGIADRLRVFGEEDVARMVPESGFDDAHAAETPFVVN